MTNKNFHFYDKTQKLLNNNLDDFVHARQNYHCGDCGIAFGLKKRPLIFYIDGNSKNKKPSNLVALCDNCYHEKFSTN